MSRDSGMTCWRRYDLAMSFLKRLFLQLPKDLRFWLWKRRSFTRLVHVDGQLLNDVVSAETMAAIKHRLAAQVGEGHVALCSGCGVTLLEVDTQTHARLLASQFIRTPPDSVVVNSRFKRYGEVTDLSQPAPW